ncbi:MAG: transposase, partial [Methylococcales bacterium]
RHHLGRMTRRTKVVSKKEAMIDASFKLWLALTTPDIFQGYQNAEVWVPSWDRSGLERLIRYCARPIFASQRLDWIEPDQRLIHRLPKPRPDGQTVLQITPLEFLDHLAALVPPSRKHRHRYCLAYWPRMRPYAPR